MKEFWKAKLAGWLHDPAEKALVLMRDPGVGHEQGTVKHLREELGIGDSDFDKQADWMASGADRPNWPDNNQRGSWAQVRFANSPVLIHPLSGTTYDLRDLKDVQTAQIKAVSLDHFSNLIERTGDGSVDYRLTHLAFWRFGYEPELVGRELGALWQVLPADSRIPDHSIWDHLNLVSALAGAIYEGHPAMLTMSFGPVQGFIAQARSTSDLWAGSHLLSTLIWAGLQLLCEEIGPDAVLYPSLRGVAAVDRWILESVPPNRREEWRRRFEECNVPWLKKSSDENPLFAATLPNKFVAVVPAAKAEELARRVAERVQEMALGWAIEAAGKLFSESSNIHAQIITQLAGFPEVNWSLAEWPVPEGKHTGIPSAEAMEPLKEAVKAFYPRDSRVAPGLFGKSVWKVLNQEVDLDGVQFYAPNAGLLYPAVYDLGDRTLAAARSCRPFEQLKQEGYRCTVCGEREWLTEDINLLSIPPGRRKEPSAWSKVAGRNGIKLGEHLCALCTLKRMWPALFSNQVRDLLDTDEVRRFVVSTHAMAMATSLEGLAKKLEQGEGKEEIELLACCIDRQKDDAVTLPKKVSHQLHRLAKDQSAVLRRIPSLLERSSDNPSEESEIKRTISDLMGTPIEGYYALLMMDGDKMGSWVSGSDEECSLTYEQSFHPQIRAEIESRGYKSNVAVKSYLESRRVISPGRQVAISTALNDFSTTVAKYVIEDCFKGRLIYAGGDDVLAMLSVDDLLPAIQFLRAAYSGSNFDTGTTGLQLDRGYARVGGRLLRMMGETATASIGAIVAHHQSPLSAVLRDLRKAEKEAKNNGRNAFCLRVLKRAGGEIGITGRFGDKGIEKENALAAVIELSKWLSNEDVSRRAVYNSVRWLKGLPKAEESIWRGMVGKNLSYQMTRQSNGSGGDQADGIAEHLVNAAWHQVSLLVKSDKSTEAALILEGMLVTAEFFARETHRGGDSK